MTEVEQRTEYLLDLLEVEHLRDRPVLALSLGQQQKVAIARALATNAKILLLDEPTAALDFATKDALVKILQDIQHQRLVDAIVVVTHDRDFLLRVCNYLALVEIGRVHHQGTLEGFRANPPSPQIVEALGLTG